jgi:uncharacterized membrane protein YuzA (DUF378 family)
MQASNLIYFIAVFLTVIGGVNWAVVGYTDFETNLVDKVNELTLKHPSFPKVVYSLVGISSVIVLVGNIILYRQYGTDLPFESK